jgi:uncharacterized protein YdeI (YjbR/CyaY-like superfamily)
MADGTSLGWTVVRVPFDPARLWPQRHGLRVRGTIRAAQPHGPAASPAAFAFRTSLFTTREGGCILVVNKRMQKAACIGRGSLAEIVLEPDMDDRPTPATPAELEKLLRADRALRRWHAALSPSSRKAIADLVAQPKSAASRARRAELMAERMLLAMEGERLTPPILETAFLRQPQARAGWQHMTPVQRRNHLFGIFYYQSPASRQKRAQQAVHHALRIAAARRNS